VPTPREEYSAAFVSKKRQGRSNASRGVDPGREHVGEKWREGNTRPKNGYRLRIFEPVPGLSGLRVSGGAAVRFFAHTVPEVVR
jgi:hypothetical protein